MLDPFDETAMYCQLDDCPLVVIVVLAARVAHVVPLLELTSKLLFGIAAYIFDPSDVIAIAKLLPHPACVVVVHVVPPFVLVSRFVT